MERYGKDTIWIWKDTINCHKNQNNIIRVNRANNFFIMQLRRVKTIKPLAENIGINFYDLGFGNRFLYMTPNLIDKSD